MYNLFTVLNEIDFASYADDNTPFVHGASSEDVVSYPESYSASLFEWFSNNQTNANPDICHLLMNLNRSTTIKIGEHTISNSHCEKLVGVKIVSQLSFNNNLKTITKKCRQKVHVLARITPCLCISKRKLLINGFFKAQFTIMVIIF